MDGIYRIGKPTPIYLVQYVGRIACIEYEHEFGEIVGAADFERLEWSCAADSLPHLHPVGNQLRISKLGTWRLMHLLADREAREPVIPDDLHRVFDLDAMPWLPLVFKAEERAFWRAWTRNHGYAA